jgi:hypothetical protein
MRLQLVLVIAGCLSGAQSFFLQKLAVKTNPLIPDLQTLINESQGGADNSREDEIKSLMVAISESRTGDQRKSLSGQWDGIWTTEKEVNFFKTSWPFAKVSDITQDLDLYDAGMVKNSIEFEGGGQFAVTGAVMPVDGDGEYDRVAFEFKSAVVSGWGKQLSLPPLGTGWFDTMYCDNEYRLSQDLRGDWSIFRKR